MRGSGQINGLFAPRGGAIDCVVANCRELFESWSITNRAPDIGGRNAVCAGGEKIKY